MKLSFCTSYFFKEGNDTFDLTLIKIDDTVDTQSFGAGDDTVEL